MSTPVSRGPAATFAAKRGVSRLVTGTVRRGCTSHPGGGGGASITSKPVTQPGGTGAGGTPEHGAKLGTTVTFHVLLPPPAISAVSETDGMMPRPLHVHGGRKAACVAGTGTCVQVARGRHAMPLTTSGCWTPASGPRRVLPTAPVAQTGAGQGIRR